MKFHVVAVKDELTNNYLQPTFAEDEKSILRVFDYQINNTPIWKDNPSDFSLYHLGLYDDATGYLESHIFKMCGGESVKRKENSDDLHTVEQTKE